VFCNEWIPPSNLSGVFWSRGKESTVVIFYSSTVYRYHSFVFLCLRYGIWDREYLA